jgi:hypothetical protein
MAARLSALRARRTLPPGFFFFLRFLVLISVTGWVDPRAIVRPEGLGKLQDSFLGYLTTLFQMQMLHNIEYYDNRIISGEQVCSKGVNCGPFQCITLACCLKWLMRVTRSEQSVTETRFESNTYWIYVYSVAVLPPVTYRLAFLLIFEYKKESAETELGEVTPCLPVPLHLTLTSASMVCLRLGRKTVKPQSLERRETCHGQTKWNRHSDLGWDNIALLFVLSFCLFAWLSLLKSWAAKCDGYGILWLVFFLLWDATPCSRSLQMFWRTTQHQNPEYNIVTCPEFRDE